ncbi:MAG: ABC transporter ATP-binding protein [Candidatus Nanopelagicales bacterium]
MSDEQAHTGQIWAARADDLVVNYGKTRALRGLTMGVRLGALTTLLGPNGAGKSTTLGVLAGLVRPDSGSATIFGAPAGSLSARQRLGVMLQEGGIPTGARGPSIVRHIAGLRGAAESAEHWIDQLDLDSIGRTTFRRMSGGQKKRVALACALVGHPDLVFVDEPTAGLDPPGRLMVWEALDALRRQGVTVVLCTHDLEEAERLADDVIIIHEGVCRLQEPLTQVLAQARESVDFDAPLHLDLTGLQSALSATANVEERSPGRYRIVGDVSPQTLATVTAWCSQHGVMARGLRVGGTRLEDRYWDITGDGPSTPAPVGGTP